MRDWYSPRDIDFSTRDQLEWVMAHLQQLKDGVWPKQETGYAIEPEVKSSRSSKAAFETPVQISAELERRAESVGPDALMAVLNRGYGFTIGSLAKFFNLEEHVVTYRCHCAIRFMIGRNFRASFYRRDHVAAYTDRATKANGPAATPGR